MSTHSLVWKRVDPAEGLCYYPGMDIAVLQYVQVALSILLMLCVILQRTGASLGGAFGADNFSTGFHTRRGFEKTLFRATIVLAALFALSALAHLFIG